MQHPEKTTMKNSPLTTSHRVTLNPTSASGLRGECMRHTTRSLAPARTWRSASRSLSAIGGRIPSRLRPRNPESEETRPRFRILPLHFGDDHQFLAEVRVCFPRGMHQRYEHLLRPQPLGAHIILHNGVWPTSPMRLPDGV